MTEILDQKPDFNLAIFKTIIHYVSNQEDYKHLFNDQDSQIINSFNLASEGARRLYIALYLRKHRWIRTKHINYPNIAYDLTPFFQELMKLNLIGSMESVDDLDEILDFMENHELKMLIKKLKTVNIKYNNNNYCNKRDMIKAILNHTTSINSVLKFQANFKQPKSNPVKAAVLREAKKIVNSNAVRLLNEPWELFSRMTYLYYPPQVNEDENGKVLSYEMNLTREISFGKRSLPEYNITRKTVIYQSREDLIQYEKACRLESQVMKYLDQKEYDRVLDEFYFEAWNGYNEFISSPSYAHTETIPSYLRNATAGHVYLRCLTHMIAAFEAKRKYHEAVNVCRILLRQNVFCLSYKGKFYERMVIDLEKHLKKPDVAFQALLDALNDVHVKEHFRYALYLRAKNLQKKVNISWMSKPDDINYKFLPHRSVEIVAPTLKKTIAGRRYIFMKYDGETNCSVEEAAMQFYQRDQRFPKGVHSESSIFHALLMLLLWDAIYYDQLEDAFRTHNQSLPLDFVSEDFYPRRQARIDRRFEALESMSEEDITDALTDSWTRHFGTRSLVDWQIELEHLKEIAVCIGMKPLTAIFRRLLSNFRFNRSGFPDLIMWDARKRKALLVEVKGPGDSLSSKQIMWLEYFGRSGIDCEVAYVKAK